MKEFSIITAEIPKHGKAKINFNVRAQSISGGDIVHSSGTFTVFVFGNDISVHLFKFIYLYFSFRKIFRLDYDII